MKQRLGVVVGVLAALLVGSFAMAGTASASVDRGAQLQQQIKRQQVQVNRSVRVTKRTCQRVRRAKGRAKLRVRKRCNVSKRKVRNQRRQLTRSRNQLRTWNAQFFDVCARGCKYRKIQDAVLAAGAWKFRNKNRNATVRVQPGTYKEGVLVHGQLDGHDYRNLTIMGVTAARKSNPNARAVILEGEGALTDMKASPTWRPGDPETQVAQNAIEAVSTVGVTMKNMWARHYQNNTFFVYASNVEADGHYCADYVMDNLVSSDTRAYGLFARNCYGGEIINSEGWGHGDSTVYIGETPCDTWNWTNKGDNPPPCQADPNWTLVKNIKSWGNPLGYSGTNSKYVRITDSKWFNNGAGLVPNTLDSELFEPTGDLIIENNDIFWNNYNYYQPNSGFRNVIGNGNPIGVGIMLYGADGVISRNNRIFGHEKWGAAAFSGPEAFGVNTGDDAKNMNNQFIDNEMGRNGVDPNALDFFNDYSGGGNCWSGNTAQGGVTYAEGNGNVPVSTIYPACPQAKVLWKNVDSVAPPNIAGVDGPGLQANWDYIDLIGGVIEPWRDLSTIFGVAEVRPSLLQECGMTVVAHPPYTVDGETFESQNAARVTAQQCTDLENRPSPWNG